MISKLTDIHPNAKIGNNVRVDAFTCIEDDTIIGDNSWIGPNVTIMKGSRLGKNCRVFPGAVIGAVPQDLKYDGEYTTVEIGDNVTIRECVTLNRGTKDKHKTSVGNNCLLMAYVHVAHDCSIGNNCIIANSANIAGHVVIEDWVNIEGVVAIQQFVHIGQHSFIAGGSLVRKNVPPYVKAAREPLAYAGVNSIGLKRRGFEDKIIMAIEDIYRIIYVHNGNISNALKVVDLEVPASREKEIILNFIDSSTKGIIRGMT